MVDSAAKRPVQEEALRLSEQRFRMLVESVHDYAIFMLDPEGYVTSWNPGAERLKLYKAGEIIGKHFSIFYPEEALARGWPEYELKMARAEGRFEDEGWRVRKDGTLFWANVLITALRDSSGELVGFSKITRDLTERRRHEEDLRHSEERFRLMVEAVQDYAIFMLDPEGRVASWNAGAQRIKGYTPSEIIGQHFSRFYPADRIAAGWPEHELEMARKTGRFEDEGWRLRKDGSRFWANVVITALHDASGVVQGFTKVTRDLTERRRVETLEEEGRQINEFLAMLGHELRNPLASIRNAVAVMGVKAEADPTTSWARQVIERQVRHLGRLVDDLLDVGRITSGKITLRREAVELGAIVSRAVEAARPLHENRHQKLEVDLEGEGVPILGDTTRLVQVVLNLLSNSAKYTPEGGHVWVQARREGHDAVLRVRDDGVGMSPELIPRVFDIFVQGDRSLDRSEGGLGLDTSQVGYIKGTIGVAALLCGGILGGLAISKHGLRFWLWPMVLAMHLPDLAFAIPGATVAVHGTYGLVNEQIAFEGAVRTQAKLSEMTTGFKSLLLKVIDPLFTRKDAGTVFPIHVSGTRSHPQFGVDVKGALTRKVK